MTKILFCHRILEGDFQIAGGAVEDEHCLSSTNRWAIRGDQQCLETFLQCFIADQPKTWVLWLPWAEYWYNITFNVSTGTTPFLYGQKPQMLILFLIGETKVEAVQRDLLDKDEALRPVKYHLQRHQSRMKSYVDRKRTEKV